MKKVKKHAIFPANFHNKLNYDSEEERDQQEKKATRTRIVDLYNEPIKGKFDLAHLAKIHEFIFDKVSSYAGSVRNYGMSKGGFNFADTETMDYIFSKELPESLMRLDNIQDDPTQFANHLAKIHTLIDEAHPFREGNGRTTRLFLQQLSKAKGYELDLSKITSSSKEWIEICKEAIGGMINGVYCPPTNENKVKFFQDLITPLQEQSIIDTDIKDTKEVIISHYAEDLKHQSLATKDEKMLVEKMTNRINTLDDKQLATAYQKILKQKNITKSLNQEDELEP
ncbi:MAG: Fic/DOC family protein [Ostreibacterium sp.]